METIQGKPFCLCLPSCVCHPIFKDEVTDWDSPPPHLPCSGVTKQIKSKGAQVVMKVIHQKKGSGAKQLS